jgi:hypothetical protein
VRISLLVRDLDPGMLTDPLKGLPASGAEKKLELIDL